MFSQVRRRPKQNCGQAEGVQGYTCSPLADRVWNRVGIRYAEIHGNIRSHLHSPGVGVPRTGEQRRLRGGVGSVPLRAARLFHPGTARPGRDGVGLRTPLRFSGPGCPAGVPDDRAPPGDRDSNPPRRPGVRSRGRLQPGPRFPAPGSTKRPHRPQPFLPALIRPHRADRTFPIALG